MNETTITRRSAIRTATLSAFGVGLMGAAGARSVAASAVPDIDRAEALTLELRDLLLRLNERHRADVGHVLDVLARAVGWVEDSFKAEVAEIEAYIGTGNRVMDRVDQAEEAERRAAVTHASVVAQYAARYHDGDSEVGTAIRNKLGEIYGEELGSTIARAAFDLYLQQRYRDVA